MKIKFYEFYKAVPPMDKHYEKKPDGKLFFCDGCKEVIEIYFVNGKYREAHFPHLPTIHLDRKPCLKCRKEK